MSSIIHHLPAILGSSCPNPNAGAMHLLRNYNQLLILPQSEQAQKSPIEDSPASYQGSSLFPLALIPVPASGPGPGPTSVPIPISAPTCRSVLSTAPLFNHADLPSLNSMFGRSFLKHGPYMLRRQRGEKKPIPEDLKDDKYFERRRRNNQAAKKSRDARKMKEDQIVFRASMLEHENAVLRAQILTLREEASTLRQMLIAKKIEQAQSIT